MSSLSERVLGLIAGVALRQVVLSVLLLGILFLLPNVNATDSQTKPYQLFYDNPAAIYGRKVRYAVFRNDKKVGQHTVVFENSGNSMVVTVTSDLVVRYLGVPVYRFFYSTKEVWVDEKLQSVESEIRDNRKEPRIIKAAFRARVLEVTDRGKSRLAPLVPFATTHWHPGALLARRVFHTTHGRVRNVTVEKLGKQRIALLTADSGNDKSATSRAVDATHYRLSGGFGAELWYDKHDRWVRLRFKADDGSTIDYKCTSCNEL